MTTPFPVTLRECALPADFDKQHGLLAHPYKHLVHKAVLEQQMGEFESFSTNPFQLNRRSIAHSSRTWQNSEKHVYLFLGHCHHYHQVSQPTLQLFLSSTLIVKYASFHIAACHSHLTYNFSTWQFRSPQVAFTGQTCLPICMLPVHVEQHTCFARLVPWLLHQLSLAADQSRSGAHMHFVPELVTSFELPCCAYTYLSTHVPQLLELWQTDHLHTS